MCATARREERYGAPKPAQRITPPRANRCQVVDRSLVPTHLCRSVRWPIGLPGLPTEISWPAPRPPEYYAFENALPAADGWMAASSALAPIGLLRRKRWGTYWAIAAASRGIFLGSLDVLFNLENGIYRQRESRRGPHRDASQSADILSVDDWFGLGLACLQACNGGLKAVQKASSARAPVA